MKTKFLLPVLATIFATAMSFTTARTNADPSHDYIFRNGAWQQISEITSCTPKDLECKVLVMPDEDTYQVYDSQNFSEPKNGDGKVSKVITLP